MRDNRALASTVQVAEFLGVPPRTLDQWAYKGIGPRWSKIGRHRRYRWTDVETYVEAQTTAST
jgi:excisionase family DNA binding protein